MTLLPAGSGQPRSRCTDSGGHSARGAAGCRPPKGSEDAGCRYRRGMPRCSVRAGGSPLPLQAVVHAGRSRHGARRAVRLAGERVRSGKSVHSHSVCKMERGVAAAQLPGIVPVRERSCGPGTLRAPGPQPCAGVATCTTSPYTQTKRVSTSDNRYIRGPTSQPHGTFRWLVVSYGNGASPAHPGIAIRHTRPAACAYSWMTGPVGPSSCLAHFVS